MVSTLAPDDGVVTVVGCCAAFVTLAGPSPSAARSGGGGGEQRPVRGTNGGDGQVAPYAVEGGNWPSAETSGAGKTGVLPLPSAPLPPPCTAAAVVVAVAVTVAVVHDPVAPPEGGRRAAKGAAVVFSPSGGGGWRRPLRVVAVVVGATGVRCAAGTAVDHPLNDGFGGCLGITAASLALSCSVSMLSTDTQERLAMLLSRLLRRSRRVRGRFRRLSPPADVVLVLRLV